MKKPPDKFFKNYCVKEIVRKVKGLNVVIKFKIEQVATVCRDAGLKLCMWGSVMPILPNQCYQLCRIKSADVRFGERVESGNDSRTLYEFKDISDSESRAWKFSSRKALLEGRYQV